MAQETSKPDSTVPRKFEPLPLLFYDTDNGLGYGVKAFLLNYVSRHESFDFLFARSTKGFQNYEFVFSVPDFELRQGKKYSISLDLKIEHIARTDHTFYGIGNKSKFKDEMTYEWKENRIDITIGRGFSNKFVGQAGLRYKNTIVAIPDENLNTIFMTVPPWQNRSDYITAFIKSRYDSRISYIHPLNGIVYEAEIERVLYTAQGAKYFTRFDLRVQKYFPLIFENTAFASRLWMQMLHSDDLPFYTLIKLGGDDSLRGFPLGRFVDKTFVVFNNEIRFPIFWRFGAVIGTDIGQTWPAVSRSGFTGWKYNLIAGGRFYFDTFVVRADLGFSKETTGFYLDFGHVF